MPKSTNKKPFRHYLDKVDEVGVVTQAIGSLVKVSGLPQISPDEAVMFEKGQILGVTTGIQEESADILVLSDTHIPVDTKVARLNSKLGVSSIDVLGKTIQTQELLRANSQNPINTTPAGIGERSIIDKPLTTGVGIVDITVPLGKGQRELVIGDKKVGKTMFLLHTMHTQASQGTICIYAAIGKRKEEIIKISDFAKSKKISKNTCVLSASASSSPGLIYLTPYVAMTIAENFRDQGKDVLLILDDMSTQAKAYREISLLARTFPGRESYPGNIFHAQAKLLERAGNYKKGSITALPVVESKEGDIAGYIQTNLMSMTDGHIYFDSKLFNQGRRPAVNPLISVTRVGLQAQQPLYKDISRAVSKFLANYERAGSYMHFGSELTEDIQSTLALGKRLMALFDQQFNLAMKTNTSPKEVNAVLLAGLWAGFWREVDEGEMKKGVSQFTQKYTTDPNTRKKIDQIVNQSNSFSKLIGTIKKESDLFIA